jgi:uncharacterized protein (DUF1330 family)
MKWNISLNRKLDKPVPKAYLLVTVDVTNSEKYEGYRALSGPAMAAHGGRFIVRGGKMEVLEGEWPRLRNVVIEFDSFDAAKAAYHSVEYAAARDARAGAAKLNMIVVEGVA